MKFYLLMSENNEPEWAVISTFLYALLVAFVNIFIGNKTDRHTSSRQRITIS